MRRMSHTPVLTSPFVLAAAFSVALAATPSLADTPVQAGTAGGVRGEVQLAKADFTNAQHEIGHRIDSGAPIYMGDQIATGPGGALQVMLLDQTTLTLGQNAKLTVDDMVFDAKSGTGRLKFSALQGAFRFVSGQIAKSNPENVEIRTPTAVIGIRGTIVGGSVETDSTVVALLGPGSDNNASSRHGAIEVSTPYGAVMLTRTGYATEIRAGQAPTSPAPTSAEQMKRLSQTGAGSNSSASSTSQPSSGNGSASGSASSAAGESLQQGGALSTAIATIIQQQAAQQSAASSAANSTVVSTAADSETLPTLDTLPNGYLMTMPTGTGIAAAESTSSSILSLLSDSYSGTLTYNSEHNITISVTDQTTGTVNSRNIVGESTDASDGITPVKAVYYSWSSGSASATLYLYDVAFGMSYSTIGKYKGSDSDGTTSYGTIATGVLTPLAQMPSSGSASYSGYAVGYYAHDASTLGSFYGTTNLTADFASHSISGSITNIKTTTGSGSESGIILNSATISGNSYSGTAYTVGGNESGTWGGRFFGPKAAETAGVFALSNSNKQDIIGAFIAKK